ncbi:MAG: family 43 glycosylhydrolase [Lentisphaeria bacterium]
MSDKKELKHRMMFTDTSRGRAFAKDPGVIEFKGQYFLYYSISPFSDDRANDGFRIGIAVGKNLITWEKIGEIAPLSLCDKKGLCAPGPIVLNGKVYLFYQTYGNNEKDAICLATSEDGIHFVPNETNPIFSPTGNWNCGRAIDADVIPFKDELLLYFSSRDPDYRTQITGVASAPLNSDFSRNHWKQRCNAPILKPELPWEQACIEASALCEYNGKLYMFYGGAYNNSPQQIGCAVSTDGINWQRISDKPVLTNGKPGEWNSSESGHPFVLETSDNEYYLFYQGNNDNGKTWSLSQKKLCWNHDMPLIQ